MCTVQDLWNSSSINTIAEQNFCYYSNRSKFLGNLDNFITTRVDKNIIASVLEPDKAIEIAMTSARYHEYRPYGQWPNANFWGYTPIDERRAGTLFTFPHLFLYRLQGFYNFSESATFEELKISILEKITARLLAHNAILSSVIFINRVTTELIKIDLLLFCNNVLISPEEELTRLIQIDSLSDSRWAHIKGERSNYLAYVSALRWQHWAYTEIFWNSDILSGTAFIGSFICKTPEQILQHFTSKNHNLYSDFMFFFCDYLNSYNAAWFEKHNDLYNFQLWLGPKNLPHLSFLLFKQKNNLILNGQ